MFRSITRWLDPIIVIGLIISIAVGILMVWGGNDTLSGLTVSLLATIVTLLVEIIARIHRAEYSLLQGLEEVEQTLRVTGAGTLKPLLSREALYREIGQLVKQCSGTEIIRATSLGKRDADPGANVDVNYIDTVATKISQSKRGKLGMLYRTVVTNSLSKVDFDTAIRSRHQAFQKHGILDRLEMHSSADIWSMDLIIIGTQHLIIAFPAQGQSYVINLGIRISNPELVENIARWYDECLWVPTSKVELPK